MAQKKHQARQKTAPSGRKGGGNTIFLGLFVLLVVAGVAWLLLARGGGAGQSVALPTPEEFDALSATVEADPSVGIAIGPESAPIELVEFADFSCPHCANFAGFAGKLLRQNYVEVENAPVRWVMYDFVLGTFPNSIPASMAARCAGEQGQYWPMHDLLFARQTRWYTSREPEAEFEEIARQVGLDLGRYRECMAEGRYLNEIAASRKYGDQLGVSSTPTLFLNGEKLDLGGVEPYEYIEGLIRQKLAEPAGDGASAPGAAPEDAG